jgi:RNase P subunit RPR2
LSRRMLRDLLVQRVELLEELALECANRDFSLATGYARMAVRLKRRHRLRVGRLMMCKGCDSPLVPGVSARVRKRRHMTITCLRCGRVIRKRVGG